LCGLILEERGRRGEEREEENITTRGILNGDKSSLSILSIWLVFAFVLAFLNLWL
jgi:hypothetical protein